MINVATEFFIGVFFIQIQITGTPLSAAKRLQFALEVKPIPEVAMMKDMPEVIFPLFWVEEGAHLGKDFTNPIRYTLFL